MDHSRSAVLRALSIVAASVLVAVFAVDWLIGVFTSTPGSTPGPGATPSASFPAAARSHVVISVVDAIAIQGKDDPSEVVVAGWFQQPFPFGCPAPLVPPVPLLEGCGSSAGWLMADPESLVLVHQNGMEMRAAAGPAIEVAFDGPDTNWERPLPQVGGSIPLPAVFVGHFDDVRATGCQPENRQSCLDRFVVTDVSWVDGKDRP